MLWLGIPVIISISIGFILFYGFPSLVPKKTKPDFLPKVSIIIPARNEEYNLPALLGSIKSQTSLPHEIIVVDDNSTDGTARKAVENGAEVVNSGPLPEGWLGKPWSCYQGAAVAKGDVFIFLDADIFLEPDALEKILCNYTGAYCVISIFPYHRIKKAYEAFSAIFNLLQLAGMYQISPGKNREPAGMFGPCLVISRKDYFKINGHKAVGGEVLEHYAMAGILKKQDIPVRLFRGKGSVNVRMYPEGWKSLVSGWSKSFTRGAEKTPPLNMFLSIVWIFGLFVSWALFLCSFFSNSVIAVSFWTAVYILSVFQLFFHFRSIGNFPFWSAVCYPANLLFFLMVFIFAEYRSSKNRQFEWKGRKIN